MNWWEGSKLPQSFSSWAMQLFMWKNRNTERKIRAYIYRQFRSKLRFVRPTWGALSSNNFLLSTLPANQWWCFSYCSYCLPPPPHLNPMMSMFKAGYMQLIYPGSAVCGHLGSGLWPQTFSNMLCTNQWMDSPASSQFPCQPPPPPPLILFALLHLLCSMRYFDLTQFWG